MKQWLPVLALAACSSATTTVRWTQVEDVAPVDSLIVFSAVQSEGFTGLMYEGFEKELRSGFAACRVRSDFRRGLASQQDEDRMMTALRAMRPNAALRVMRWGGEVVTTVTPPREPLRSKSDLSFKLELFDTRAGKVTWRAMVDLRVESGTGTADGEAFAATILWRLRNDGVLATCAR